MTTLLELCPGLSIALDRANFKSSSTPIPNDHQVIDAHEATLKRVAEVLGVDFQATRYTFNVNVKAGNKNIYGLVVAENEGKPALYWGGLAVNLETLKVQPAIATDDDGKVFLEFDIDDETTLTVPMSLLEKPKASELRKAMNKDINGLAAFLKPGFVRPMVLSQVPVGTYQATAYKVSKFSGKDQYTIKLEGVGWVKCNTRLGNRLAAEPVITPECPATVTIEPVTDYTSQGHPIVPVTIECYEDSDIPVFDFD